MAKAARSIGRSLKKVVDGAKKLVKKVASSKVFKAVAIAAAVYFTGGAVLGAMGGASAASTAGTSMLAGAAKGAVAGLGSAGAGISSAWSSLLGGNIAGVGSSLAGGMTGASAAGGSAAAGGFTSAMGTGFNATKGLLNPGAAPVATGPLASGYSPSPSAAFNPGANAASGVMPSAKAAGGTLNASNVASASMDQLLAQTPGQLQALKGSMTAGQQAELTRLGVDMAAKPGLLKSMLTSPYAVPMAMQIGGNAMAGKAEAEYADEKETDDRERYNRNIGTRLFQSAN